MVPMFCVALILSVYPGASWLGCGYCWPLGGGSFCQGLGCGTTAGLFWAPDQYWLILLCSPILPIKCPALPIPYGNHATVGIVLGVVLS